jgi:alpha-ketoglutarate-dependent taurine dioxygenase
MALQSVEMTPRIGSELRLDPAVMLRGDHGQEIRDLLDQRGVLVFRDAPFEDDELKKFAATIGTVFDEGEKGIFKVTMDPEENPSAYILYGTRVWHMDRLDTPVPPRGSMLSPRVLPSEGGDTEFTNTYAAYDDLPEADKRRFENLEVEHHVSATFRRMPPEFLETAAQIPAFNTEPRRQPLVWRHRSGRKSLVFGTTAARIVGLPEDESAALIDWLLAWMEQPQYVYRHQWRMGDLVVWDNTGTMHRVRPFDPKSGRRLHRVTLVGEEPVAAV